MIPSGALFRRESLSRAILLLRLSPVVLLWFFFALSASAQYQTYLVFPNDTAIPAGSFGLNSGGVVYYPPSSSTPPFNICFYTGFGSTTPIAPTAYVFTGYYATFNYAVPASTIQDVPPTSFSAGAFRALVYTVPTSFATCTGAEQALGNSATVTLNYPTFSSYSLPFLPEQNSALSSRLPSSLGITGAYFIANSGTKGTVPSAVSFTADATLPGMVRFISSSSLVSTIPLTIPDAANPISIQICNNAKYSYCSNSVSIQTAQIQPNPGTLTASPSPAQPTQPVTLTANFGPAMHTVAGAPSGLVTFSDGGKTLGSSKLVLNQTATFAQAPTQQFFTYALPIAPIVADFNLDGIPDTLLIDPGTGNAGASLNLLLGTVPNGSFAVSNTFSVQRDTNFNFVIRSAAVGDFNGDGIPDIVLLAQANTPGAVSNPTLYTLLGNGDGTFQNGVVSSPILYGSQIVAGDFNKDGKQDIVIAGALNNDGVIGLQTLLGNGAGKFTAGPSTTGLRTEPDPNFGDFKVAAADFNNDGYPDIAVMNGYSPRGQLDKSIEVYQNSGKGTFDAPVQVQTDGTATVNFSIAALGPAKPLDIIVTSAANHRIDVALNQSTTAKIAFSATFKVTQVPGLIQTVFGDFDGDGLLDVAVEDQKTIHVLSGDGSGTFAAKYASLSIPPPTNTALIAASDENGDTYADLLLYTAGAQDGNTRYPITLYDYITAGTATATFPAATYAAGAHTLRAATDGTFDILGGTAAATLEVTQIAPTILLTSSPRSPQSYVGLPTTLIGTVIDNTQDPGAGSTATGTASFYNGKTLVGTAPLVTSIGAGGEGNAAATLNLVRLPVGTYSFTVRYPGDANHAAATSRPLAFQVTAGTPGITWRPSPASISYGTPLSSAQLNAVATGVVGEIVPGSFTYAPALGTVLPVGSNPVVATFTPTDPNYTTTTATENIVVTQAKPVITWLPNPGNITSGTALSAAQLDATSNTPGTFVYTPASGTVLAVGSQTLNLTFTPKDKNDFTSASKSVTINVRPSGLTVTPTSLTFGNQAYGTTSAPQVVTISNPGTLAINIDSASYTGPNPKDFIPTSNCPAALLPSTSCHISFTFTPDGVGSKTGVFGISDNSNPPVQNINLSGTGTGGVLQVIPGNLKTIAGDGVQGYTGNGGLATAAELNEPDGLAFDSSGDLYIADTANNVVRKVDSRGNITTVAGTGKTGYAGDGGQATSAELATPFSVTLDRAGNLYIEDTGNNVIRKIDTSGIITTFAGIAGVAGHSGDGGPATRATFYGNQGARFDNAGNLFVPQCDGLSVRKIDTKGIITTVAGNFTAGYSGDGGPATSAQLHCPGGVAIDPQGNFYIADNGNNVIRKVNTAGIITTIAGNGTAGSSGDGGLATAATLNLPTDVALDAAGDLYIADIGNNRIRKIDAKGIITTVAGGLNNAGSAGVNSPAAVTVDASGNLYFSDTNNNAVRELYPLGIAPFPDTAIETTAAPKTVTLSNIGNVPIVIPSSASFTLGGNASDFSLSGGTCLKGATLVTNQSTCTLQISFTPTAAGARSLTVSVADNALNSPQTFIIGGNGTSIAPSLTWTAPAAIVYGTPLSATQLDAVATGLAGAAVAGTFAYTPAARALLTAGTHTLSVLFTPTDTADYTSATRTVTLTVLQAAPIITWVPNPASITSGTALSAAQLDATANTAGIFAYSPASGTFPAVGTQPLNVTFTPTDATDFTTVSKSVTINVLQAGLTLNPKTLTFGNQPYNTSSAAQTVTVTNPGTEAISISGTYSEDEPNPEDFIPTTNCPASLLPGATCQISVTFLPDGVGPKSGAIDIDTNVPYESIAVSGTGTGGILQVNPGNLKTIAGNGTQGDTGDGGLATAAELDQPDGVAFDSLGNLYIADTDNSVVRKVDTHGEITTVAGTGTAGYSGDGGLATGAKLDRPYSVTLDTAGNLYIEDTGNALIRKVDSKGVITTFAGTADVPGHSGDGGPATMATFEGNQGARFDAAGNLFVPQCEQASVRKIDTKGIITTVAGTFTSGYTGDGKQATSAQLFCPSGVAIDTAGNFYIADYFNHAIRKVDTSGIITTIAGNGTPGATGDGSQASAATLNLPNDVVFDAAGNLFIADSGNNRIRKIDTKGVISTVAGGLNSAGSAIVNTPYGVTLDPSGNLYFSDTSNNAVRELSPQGTTPFPATAIGTTAAPQTVTLSNVGNIPIVIPSRASFTLSGDATDFVLTGGTCLGGATLAANQSTCTLQISFTPTAAGARTLTVSIADNALNSPQTFTIGGSGTALLPTLKWNPPASIVYGTPLSATQLDAVVTGLAGAAVAGTFAYTPAAGTVLTAGPHTLSVVFTPASTDYLPVTTSVPITVTQALPMVSWKPAPATIAYGTLLSGAQLDATSNVPGTFAYTPATGTLLPAGTQTLSVVFTPTDTANFSAITATVAITVKPLVPGITWAPNPSDITYGTPLSGAQLDATSNVPGTFVYTPTAGTVLAAGTHALSVTFTPRDSANYSPITTTANVLVGMAQPVVTWVPSPATIIYGTAISAAQLDATSNTPGAFTYTPALGSVLDAGPHLLAVTFTPTDAADFSSITKTVPITVNPAAPIVTWNPNPATISYGTPLSAAQLDATSLVPGAYTYGPANGAVLTAGVQTLTLRFHPTDTNYGIINLTRTITVAQAKPALTWATPASIGLGTALSATQLDAVATGVGGLTLSGTFTYLPAIGTVLPAGANTLTVLFTPTDAVDYTTATATVLQAVGVPATVTRLAVTTNSSEYGQPVTFSAVTLAGFQPATGTTNFFDGATFIGSSTTSPATLTISTLTAGTHNIFATFIANESFAGNTSTAVSEKVSPAATTITWAPNPASIAFNTPLSAAQLDASVATTYVKSVPGAFTYTPALGSVLNAGSQTLRVTFTPSDAVDYLASFTTALITVTPIDPVVNWTPNPATITYGSPLSTSQLDATSTLAGAYTYAPASGAILGTGVQTITLHFHPTDSNYNTVTLTRTIIVAPASAVVTWTPSPAAITYGTGLAASQLDATSSTPGTFTYTPALGTILPAGTQTLSVLFTPTDSVNFKPLTTTATIVVTQATPAITWLPNPATIPHGTALSASQLDATANTPGTFAYTPALGTVLGAGTQTLSVVFTPTDAVDFKSITTTTSLVVTTVTPTIIWTPNPATIPFATPLSAAQLDASSNTPGTFLYTPALGTILPAGTQTLSAVFTPKDLTDFKPVTTTTTIVVSSVTPVVSWTPSPATIAYGTPLTAAQLNATSTTPGTFTYTPGLGAVLSAGTQTLSAVFTPSDAANFKPFTTTAIITVTAVTPTVAWAPNPATIAYGTPLSAAQLDATSTTPGTFTYTPALGTVLSAGTQTVSTVFTPADTVNYKSVTATTNVFVTTVTPAVTWKPTLATITYGTPLSAAQLDATSITPGTFAYSPALGTVLPVGTQTLTAVFTPKDTADYKPTTITITIVVTAATPTVTWAPTPATIAYGTALSAAQLDATSTTPGTFVYTPALGTILSAGMQTLSAVFTPTDATNFKPLTTTATITVTVSSPTIKWTPNPATIGYGTALTAAQLDAISTTPGTFVYTPALGTILTAGTQTLSAVFTPTDTTDFKPVTTTATITVTAASPTITWTPNPATITYGTALSVAQLDATSATPGTFAYTPALGTILAAGTQTLSVAFTPSDSKNFKSLTSTATITVTAATPAVIWLPNPATIPYGSALSAAQLDATSSTPGTFVYTPALGTILGAGTHSLSVAFTPTDSKNFRSLNATTSVTVQQIAPTLVWAAPASIVVGSPLSSAQLDATATGANGVALPGTFAYTPAAGTLLPAGAQTLKVVFSPTDLADYTTAAATVSLQVIPLTLTSLSTTQAALGDPAKTITLTGTGFVSTAVVQVNGSAIPTAFVNPTTLTATIPASNFLVAQILQINVVEASQNQTTASIAFLVGAPLANATFGGPSTVVPGTDTDLNFKLTNPYPVDLTATFTVSFTPAAGLPNDPGVLFANGSTTYAVVVPANSTAAPAVAVQGSTVAGSMTVSLTLEAGGVNVTPPSIQPLVIQAPLAVPEVRSASVARSGSTLTVVVHGLSNPRDMTLAKFHFTPIAGGSIGTEDVTIDVVPIFTTWYADPASLQYGSTFTYSQTFNLSSDASVVGQVSVTLTNSVGESQEADTP